jgi:hypothetical protein
MLMNEKGHRGRVLLLITLALLAIVVPYLIAWRISPAGTVFTGFLINPIDGFSYLAKMRQGFGGAWQFQLPYTAEPGSGTYLFIFYLALGHLSRVLNMPLVITYHAARVLFSLLFFALLYLFFDRLFESKRLARAGYLFSLFGSGLGWLAITLFDRQAVDLWVPEGFPFLSAYTNPHFPLAASAFLGAVLLVYKHGARTWLHRLLALICGLVLGTVLPFVTIPLFLVLGTWLVWEFLGSRNRPTIDWLGGAPVDLILLAVGALPWLLYDYSLSLEHPVISQWNAQNLTPSPPLIETVLGFGIALAISVVSLGWRPWRSAPGGRLLTAWLVIGFTLLYVPLPFQRRLSMGLYLPMVALTVWWLDKVMESSKKFWRAFWTVFVLSIPSALIVMLAGISAASAGEQAVVFSDSDLAAYGWIDNNIPDGSLVLANPTHGNRLPAFAAVRVLYGHPFETPDAEYWRQEVLSLLNESHVTDELLSSLNQYGVEWALLDGKENEVLGAGAMTIFPTRASFDGTEILEITRP